MSSKRDPSFMLGKATDADRKAWERILEDRQSDRLPEPQKSQWLDTITREGQAEARDHAYDLRYDAREARGHGDKEKAEGLEREAVSLLKHNGLDAAGKPLLISTPEANKKDLDHDLDGGLEL